MKSTDAAGLDRQLQPTIRDLYAGASAIFRRLQLVRPGKSEVGDNVFTYDVQRLMSSDPTFERGVVALDRPVKSRALAFWLEGARVMCSAVPFFRLGAPQDAQETTVYVYNRSEPDGFRWVSYQEARDQEIVVADEELLSLVRPEAAGPLPR